MRRASNCDELCLAAMLNVTIKSNYWWSRSRVYLLLKNDLRRYMHGVGVEKKLYLRFIYMSSAKGQTINHAVNVKLITVSFRAYGNIINILRLD